MARTPAHAAVESAAGTDPRLVDSALEASRAIVAVTARCLAQMDESLTVPQHRVLVFLGAGGQHRVGDVAQDLGVTLQQAAEMCDVLANKGLIRRRRQVDTDGGWDLHVRLSGRGRRLIGETMRMRREAICRLLDSVEIDPRADLAGTLHALALAAGEPGEPEWWRGWRTEGRETRRNNVAHHG